MNRGQYTDWILEKKHPAFLTLHLSSLDHIEHETGSFSPEDIAVISHHGFVRTDAQLNLFPLFREAKLISVNEKGKITDWKAMPWVTGGSAAIVLKDPNDAVTLAQVRELLEKVASDPANGVDRILDAVELHKRGGYPPASFFVGLKPGWKTGSSLDGPVLSKIEVGGTHGGRRTCPTCTLPSF